MKYTCDQCGHAVSGRDQFCPHCGLQFDDEIEMSIVDRFKQILAWVVMIAVVGAGGWLAWWAFWAPSHDELLASARDTATQTPEYAPQIQKFSRRLRAVTDRATPLWDDLVGALRGLEAGVVTPAQAYGIVERAKEASSQAAKEVLDAKPRGLSPELDALCGEVADNYSLAYWEREDAAGALLEYLNTLQVGRLHDFREHMARVLALADAARADWRTARRKVGLGEMAAKE